MADIRTNQVASNRMPIWLERPFPPGVAESGHFFFYTRDSREPRATRISNRWSQKDAPMVWVDSPPLIRPGRGVQSDRGLGISDFGLGT